MVETRAQRAVPEDAIEGTATSQPARRGQETAALATSARVETSVAAVGDMHPPTRRQDPVIPEDPYQQPPPGTIDAVQLLAFFRQYMEGQQGQQQRQTAELTRGIELAVTAVERVVAQPAAAPQPHQPREKGIQDFQKMHPRDFRGTEGILYADEWIEHMEEIFRLAEIPTRLQIEAAASMMQDLARTWYQTDPRVGTPGQTWAAFKELFKKKFFPEAAVGALETQFEALVQGSQSVEEYAGEFCRLGRFVEDLSEATKARRFRKGLVKEVKSYTKNARSTTFEEILVDALAAEDDLELRLKRGRDPAGGSSSSGGQAKRPHFQHQQPRQFQPLPIQQQFQHQAPRQTVSCPFCKKPGHGWNECRKRLGKCLFCGAADHQMRDCPRSVGRTAQGGGAGAAAGQQRGPALPTQQQRFVQHQQQARGGQQGRAYAMTLEDAQAVGEVLAEDEEEAGLDTYYGAALDDTCELDPQEDPAVAEDFPPTA
ncbi:uncharacterized protein M6B38_146650 [Iris pallida]|uniref:CCHC-type domain-containing protein n=1 Tax=Iris pallida TaxID=29817 RepID=A0AAX6F9K5_IRIPA|nr:Uncharacterized protein M6B38_224900 [Iris pallida]KAJ6808049.1 uncharacterized protein M6B38_169015 [Iris pallida]KAJ6812992.1 uncharacterized protein M6B38_146650 [Iris pallida]